MYASQDVARPAAYARVGGGDKAVAGSAALPLNTWSHLAATYDGNTLRLYVNGTLVGSGPQSGTIAVSAGVLRIGGNAVWGEYFSGLIDEVRIYSRVLAASEIQADMNTPIGPSDTTGAHGLSHEPDRRVDGQRLNFGYGDRGGRRGSGGSAVPA